MTIFIQSICASQSTHMYIIILTHAQLFFVCMYVHNLQYCKCNSQKREQTGELELRNGDIKTTYFYQCMQSFCVRRKCMILERESIMKYIIHPLYFVFGCIVYRTAANHEQSIKYVLCIYVKSPVKIKFNIAIDENTSKHFQICHQDNK